MSDNEVPGPTTTLEMINMLNVMIGVSLGMELHRTDRKRVGPDGRDDPIYVLRKLDPSVDRQAIWEGRENGTPKWWRCREDGQGKGGKKTK